MIVRHMRINANGTYLLKDGPGNLRRVLLSGMAGTLTFYDNTVGSGTVLCSMTGPCQPGTVECDIPFVLGLTAVAASGPDVTVVWD